MKKGQASIEFVIIVFIVILFVFTTTKPLLENAKGLTEDIATITRANNETKKLGNTVMEISMLGAGSKKTIELNVPKNAVVHCYQDRNIGFTVELQVPPYPEDCNNGICDKNIITAKSFNGTSPVDCNSELVNIRGQRTIEVKKIEGTQNISIK
ncbi:MAG: hypothetical protein NTZ73_04235 [Candidatus Diapherotrites archaeon]|nr:hypothetical protein [Candidatus Diapherotrites archaeon]